MAKLSSSLLFLLLVLSIGGCKTKSASILNKDENAKMPLIKNNVFVVTKVATDKNYGYSENYPINLGFATSLERNKASRYLDALAGPNGEKIIYTFVESCCPFLTNTGGMGTGLLDKYKITWEGNSSTLYLYINSYEKGEVLIPKGLTAKK